MTDKKLTDAGIPTETSVGTDSIIYGVKNPSTTPASFKMALVNLLASLVAPGADGNVLTAASGAWTSAAGGGGATDVLQVQVFS